MWLDRLLDLLRDASGQPIEQRLAVVREWVESIQSFISPTRRTLLNEILDGVLKEHAGQPGVV